MSLTLKGQVDYWVDLSSESLFDMRAALRSGRRIFKLLCTKQYAEQWTSIIEKWCADIKNIDTIILPK